jgi:hypothetical protein
MSMSQTTQTVEIMTFASRADAMRSQRRSAAGVLAVSLGVAEFGWLLKQGEKASSNPLWVSPAKSTSVTGA